MSHSAGLTSNLVLLSVAIGSTTPVSIIATASPGTTIISVDVPGVVGVANLVFLSPGGLMIANTDAMAAHDVTLQLFVVQGGNTFYANYYGTPNVRLAATSASAGTQDLQFLPALGAQFQNGTVGLTPSGKWDFSQPSTVGFSAFCDTTAVATVEYAAQFHVYALFSGAI